MPPAPHQRAPSWLVGSWIRPAVLTLLAGATAFGVVHHHRDLGSVLAAAACAVFSVQVWCTWQRARRQRPPDPVRRPND